MKAKKAFTLIEILIAVAIMAILTAIIMTSLDGIRKKSRDAKRVSDINQIRLTLASYVDRCRQYPLHLFPNEDTGCPNGVTLKTFLDPIPKDPKGLAYRYTPLGDNDNRCTSYHLGAVLEFEGNDALNEDNDATDVSASALCYADVEDYRDFDGNSTDCGQASSSPDMCYDVKP